METVYMLPWDPKAKIIRQTESKLVHVEPLAAILIANEDGCMVKPKVGVLSIRNS
jgi:hypothetical protein